MGINRSRDYLTGNGRTNPIGINASGRGILFGYTESGKWRVQIVYLSLYKSWQIESQKVFDSPYEAVLYANEAFDYVLNKLYLENKNVSSELRDNKEKMIIDSMNMIIPECYEGKSESDKQISYDKYYEVFESANEKEKKILMQLKIYQGDGKFN